MQAEPQGVLSKPDSHGGASGDPGTDALLKLHDVVLLRVGKEEAGTNGHLGEG